MKKIICSLLAAIALVGSYAFLPAKYNPIPVNSVYAAETNYKGAYRVKWDIVISKTVVIMDKYGHELDRRTEYHTIKKDQVIELDSKGNYHYKKFGINYCFEGKIKSGQLTMLYRIN